MKAMILLGCALILIVINYKALIKKPPAFDGIRLALWVNVWILMAMAGYLLGKG